MDNYWKKRSFKTFNYEILFPIKSSQSGELHSKIVLDYFLLNDPIKFLYLLKLYYNKKISQHFHH